VRRGPEIGTKMRYFKIPFCQNFLSKLEDYSRSKAA